jgi:hypothetical protein
MNKPLTTFDVIAIGVYGSGYLHRRLRSEDEARADIAKSRETEWYRRLSPDAEARAIEDGKLCPDCSSNDSENCCVKCPRWNDPPL